MYSKVTRNSLIETILLLLMLLQMQDIKSKHISMCSETFYSESPWNLDTF